MAGSFAALLTALALATIWNAESGGPKKALAPLQGITGNTDLHRRLHGAVRRRNATVLKQDGSGAEKLVPLLDGKVAQVGTPFGSDFHSPLNSRTLEHCPSPAHHVRIVLDGDMLTFVGARPGEEIAMSAISSSATYSRPSSCRSRHRKDGLPRCRSGSPHSRSCLLHRR